MAATPWSSTNWLIAKHGLTDDLCPPKPLQDGTIYEGDFYRPREFDAQGKPKHGSSLVMQPVLNGMKLQLCCL